MESKIRHKRSKRKQRVGYKIKSVSNRPRLHVYRSSRYIYAQVIDVTGGKVLASASEREIKSKTSGKTGRAKEVGKLIAQKMAKIKVKEISFNRGSYKFHGRVKALAEGAREGGLKF